MKISTELKSLQKLWKSSEVRARTDNVPDAAYQSRITEHKLERSKNGRIQVKCVLRILSGTYKGRSIYKYSGLENESNMSWFKGDMERLGVKVPKNLLHLPEALEETIDLVLETTVKTNGAYTNIYFGNIVEELDNIEDEEEEDEEEKPKKKKKVKITKKAKKKYDEEEEDEDEDDELVDEDEDEDGEEEDEED